MEQPNETIECEGFTLRRWAESDFDALLRLSEESLDHLKPWMPWARSHTPQHTRDFLAGCGPDWRSGEAYNYAITADGRAVGSFSLYQADEPQGRSLGYWLHPAATGRGIATRGAAALVTQAFALPGVEYLEIVHDPANTASAAVPERLGFTVVDTESATDVVWRLHA
ncbi:GNAT family N-acetyltransferase [Streptomyces sp. NBC_00091]|uniref:GNAT family N-acetyltransferase n=1 Tax=Streptomyces sp. NBC_00091 TaxID=2975648 RepID=UPI002256F20D|nr:GNAT family N-acetyltransferase [Streptomyces sp. NBC_00091]MCX5378580.1 GNAT family N-acetyltransferase [Streptomyces sp. NBC_00091]